MVNAQKPDVLRTVDMRAAAYEAKWSEKDATAAIDKLVKATKPKYDSSWTLKALKVPGPQPWWEKLDGEDRKNAEAWILANRDALAFLPRVQ